MRQKILDKLEEQKEAILRVFFANKHIQKNWRPVDIFDELARDRIELSNGFQSLMHALCHMKEEGSVREVTMGSNQYGALYCMDEDFEAKEDESSMEAMGMLKDREEQIKAILNVMVRKSKEKVRWKPGEIMDELEREGIELVHKMGSLFASLNEMEERGLLHVVKREKRQPDIEYYLGDTSQEPLHSVIENILLEESQKKQESLAQAHSTDYVVYQKQDLDRQVRELCVAFFGTDQARKVISHMLNEDFLVIHKMDFERYIKQRFEEFLKTGEAREMLGTLAGKIFKDMHKEDEGQEDCSYRLKPFKVSHGLPR